MHNETTTWEMVCKDVMEPSFFFLLFFKSNIYIVAYFWKIRLDIWWLLPDFSTHIASFSQGVPSIHGLQSEATHLRNYF